MLEVLTEITKKKKLVAKILDAEFPTLLINIKTGCCVFSVEKVEVEIETCLVDKNVWKMEQLETAL